MSKLLTVVVFLAAAATQHAASLNVASDIAPIEHHIQRYIAEQQRQQPKTPHYDGDASSSSSSTSSVVVGAEVKTIAIASAQFRPVNGSTPLEIITNNAKQTLTIAMNVSTTYAKSKGAASMLDLITFPEFAQFGPKGVSAYCSADPATRFKLLDGFCEDIPPAGTQIDCSGGGGQKALSPYQIIGCGLMLGLPVNNVLTVSYNTCQRNPSSTASAPSYYNTQVVVGNGKVLAVYPKFHPFFTNCFDKPSLQLTTFQTAASKATFGLFTCFDIMFSDPKDNLVQKGVKLFSYSAAIPMVFSTAVALFSSTNNVTVAASNMDGQSSVFVNGKNVGAGGAGCPSDIGASPCVAIGEVQI